MEISIGDTVAPVVFLHNFQDVYWLSARSKSFLKIKKLLPVFLVSLIRTLVNSPKYLLNRSGMRNISQCIFFITKMYVLFELVIYYKMIHCHLHYLSLLSRIPKSSRLQSQNAFCCLCLCTWTVCSDNEHFTDLSLLLLFNVIMLHFKHPRGFNDLLHAVMCSKWCLAFCAPIVVNMFVSQCRTNKSLSLIWHETHLLSQQWSDY